MAETIEKMQRRLGANSEEPTDRKKGGINGSYWSDTNPLRLTNRAVAFKDFVFIFEPD